MAFLRFFDSVPPALQQRDPNASHLAGKLFSRGTPNDRSVYDASTGQQELENATAFRLTKKNNFLQAVLAIRIDQAEIDATGLCVDQSEPGETQVMVVDKRHGNLAKRGTTEPATDAELIALFERVIEAMRTGEDRVRHFYQFQLATMMRTYANQTAGIGAIAMSRCNEALGTGPIN